MELFPTLTFETFAAMLHALSSGHAVPTSQECPVERGYQKYVFNLESKEDEDEWEVVIKATIPVVLDDCNDHQDPGNQLTKAPLGYYWMDYPEPGGQTKVACYGWKGKIANVRVANNVVSYSSQAPIVIHAAYPLHIWHEVRRKTPTGETSSVELPTS